MNKPDPHRRARSASPAQRSARSTSRARRSRTTDKPQVELALKQRNTWGGARPGAGRPRSRGRHDSPHTKRPVHKARHPSLITLRVIDGLPLRRRDAYACVERALVKLGVSDTFRVVHVSIQNNHIHLIVEAADEVTLAAGVKRLEILIAKQINKKLVRTGEVFPYRYHRRDITSPRYMRNALAYVLNNWRRHRMDVTTPGAENALIDPYSTAWAFDGWRDLDELPNWPRLPSAEPRTWLLRVGWRRHGELSVREVPGPI